jgi:hypothetical protein
LSSDDLKAETSDKLLGNLCVISSRVCRIATYIFLISRLSVELLTSILGQLEGSCESYCGLFHHSMDFADIVETILLEMR